MIPSGNEVHQLHAQICSALSDPTRILLLYALAEAPQNVSDLTATLGQPQSTVSRHLALLRGAGLVSAARNGRNVVYDLADRRVIQALDLMRGVLADHMSKQAELLATGDDG